MKIKLKLVFLNFYFLNEIELNENWNETATELLLNLLVIPFYRDNGSLLPLVKRNRFARRESWKPIEWKKEN